MNINDRLIDRFGHYGQSVYALADGRRVLLTTFPAEGEFIEVKPVRACGGEWTRRDCSHGFGPFTALTTGKASALLFADTL